MNPLFNDFSLLMDGAMFLKFGNLRKTFLNTIR